MKTYVVLDFETASACNLKKCGAYVYARHPTTEIICLNYNINGRMPITLWATEIALQMPRLLALANDPAVIFVAHNASFERNIWTAIMVGRFGWPDISLDRWHDTMAVALSKGLPAGLDNLARALKLPEQKDKEGKALTLSLSVPRKATKANKALGIAGMLDRTLASLQRAGTYCASDVTSETQVLNIVGRFDGNEREVWRMDQRINDRGILVDRKFVNAGLGIIHTVIPSLVKEFNDLTGIEKPSQGAKLKEWLTKEGLPVANLQKATVDKLLGEAEEQELALSDQDDPADQEIACVTIPPQCLTALKLRSQTISASVKKLPAMLQVMGDDDRARGLLQYHGAGPGRWAGRLLQPHNFPRGGAHNTEDLSDAILAQDIDYLRAVYGDPITALSHGLRHALIAEPGKVLQLGDYTQIEARIVLALAGATEGLAAFQRGKPYIEMAEKIFHRPIDKKLDIREYTIGKNTILGCGFQMGASTFRNRYCPDESMEFAQAGIDAYRKDLAPEVVTLWYALEKAAADCVWEKRTTEAYGCQFRIEGAWLTIRIPSGRKLWFYDPQPCDGRFGQPAWHRYAFGKSTYCSPLTGLPIPNRLQMYGGIVTENVVQGLARDLLVAAMFRCERLGLPIVLTVHDEIVLEIIEKYCNLLEQCMTEKDPWVKDMKVPINIEGATTLRYKK